MNFDTYISCTQSKGKFSLTSDLAKVILSRHLSKYHDLVVGLYGIIKLGCTLGFDDDVVNYILYRKNFQMFLEDKFFWHFIFLR